MSLKHLACSLFSGISLFAVSMDVACEQQVHGYPRIWGMNIGRPAFYDELDYQEKLSRLDVVILGFWANWRASQRGITERQVVANLKRRNPHILVGQYTILNEWKEANQKYNMRQDVSRKIDEENWWLRDASGNKVQWTNRYGAWDINITKWTSPDSNGMRYPEWLAMKDFSTYFSAVPEFDIWYFDNALSRPPSKKADWTLDSVDERGSAPDVVAAYRRGQVAHWEAAHKVSPKLLRVGNTDDISVPEFRFRLEGVFLEALIGASWSTERREGWAKAMQRYRDSLRYTLKPHLVGFNVHGGKEDYQLMRYGLCSALLDDGYFSYTATEMSYGDVAWFDEFDVELGQALDSPPSAPFHGQVWRRDFTKGLVLVNPGLKVEKVELPPGYSRIAGKQEPTINDGSAARVVTLKPKDGLVLLKTFGQQ